MNVRDITDAEVYELGLRVLLDKLGHAGVIRFLQQCEPATGDYTVERHKWLDALDMETILRGIRELRQEKQESPKNEQPKTIDEMTDLEVYRFGLSVISGKMGVSGQMRFLRLCKPVPSDCTLASHKKRDTFDQETILAATQVREADPAEEAE